MWIWNGRVVVRDSKKAAWLPWSLKGGAQHIQISPRTPCSTASVGHVQSSRAWVAREVGCSKVAQMNQKGGRRIAVIAQWSPNVHHVINALCCKTHPPESFKEGTTSLEQLTETQYSGFRRPSMVLVIFRVAQSCNEGRSPLQRGLYKQGSFTPTNIMELTHTNYRKISNIRRTKSQNLNVSYLGLQLSLCNILKPSV